MGFVGFATLASVSGVREGVTDKRGVQLRRALCYHGSPIGYSANSPENLLYRNVGTFCKESADKNAI